MVNAELIEYAKNQLQAGSSANYIRTVLIKQGWGERDVDDALGIAQSEAGPVSGGVAAPAKGIAEAKPEARAGKNKFLAVAGILTGVFFVITSGVIIYMLTVIEVTFVAMEAAMGATGIITDMVSGYMVLGWVLGIIGLIAGIFWIIVGTKEFMK